MRCAGNTPTQPDVFQQKLNDALNDSLEQLVERQLILRSFRHRGLQVARSVVDQLVQDRIRERFGDRVTFMKTLQAQGMTVEQFRKQVRDQYIDPRCATKMSQQEIVISPYKIETYYQAHQDDFRMEDQIKLRMIVLNKTSPDDTNTVKLAREIQAKIKDGATFQPKWPPSIRKARSKSQGGDWGWVERSVLRKELADVAFALKPGQVSDVIDTPRHLSTSCSSRTSKPAHAKPAGRSRATKSKKPSAPRNRPGSQKQWIDGLKKKTFIRYF